MPAKNPQTKKKKEKRKEEALANILEDMQEDRKRLEDQRVAILNILEDVNEAQTELKKNYSELEIIKNFTQSLGLSMELESVARNMSQAIEQIFPGVIITYCLAPLESDELPNKINIYANQTLGEKNLKSIGREIIKGLEENIMIPGVEKNLEKLKNTELTFKISSLKNQAGLENKKIKFSASGNNIPIVIANQLIGIFNISRDDEFSLNEKEMSVVNTILGSAIQTIERLRILVRSEQTRLNSLVESMSNGVLMFDLEEKIIVANPVIKEIIGPEVDSSLNNFLNRFEKVEKTFGEIKSEVEKIDIGAEVKTAISENQSASFQEVQIETRTFEVFITPIRDYKEEVSGGAIILHDITRLKEINQMKSEFVSVASHQLRTPLTSIRLFMEMLERGDVGALNSDQKEYVNNTLKSTQSMIQLVNDLLNLSRIEADRLKIDLAPLRLEDLIDTIIAEAEALANEKKCKIIFEKPDPPTKEILMDANLLRQVAHNLVTNAIRYSKPDQCNIHINIRKKEKKGKNTKDFYLISVKDSGIGIPEDAKDKIFGKFVRANNAIKTSTDGSGLGLYVAKMVIEKLGGEIWFDSIEDKGTTFFVAVPINNAA